MKSSSSNSSSSSTINKIKLEQKKDEINSNNNINEKSLYSTRKDYTLKDLLNNESIISGKTNKNFEKNNENNSDLFSGKESFSINKSKNTIKNEEIKSIGNLRGKDDDKNFSSSDLSDSLSGSQKINMKNKLDLTFSSRQS